MLTILLLLGPVFVIVLVGKSRFKFSEAGFLDGNDFDLEREVLAREGVVTIYEHGVAVDFLDRVYAVALVAVEVQVFDELVRRLGQLEFADVVVHEHLEFHPEPEFAHVLQFCLGNFQDKVLAVRAVTEVCRGKTRFMEVIYGERQL